MTASVPAFPLPVDARLIGLDIRWADGSHEMIALEGGPRLALDRGAFAEAPDVGNLVADLLCGAPARGDVKRADLRFACGSDRGETIVRRDYERDRTLLVEAAGAETPLGISTSTPLPGLDRATLRRSSLLRGGDHAAVGGGAEALAAALRRLFGVGDAHRDAEAERRREIEDTRARLQEVEAALRELGGGDGPPIAPGDPPELGALLESLEEAREIDRRLVGRRLDLARELAAITEEGRPSTATPPAALRELRECHRLLDACEREIQALRGRAEPGRASGITAVFVLIGLLVASGLMLAGRFALDDPALSTLGLRAAAGVLGFGLLAWIVRGATILQLGSGVQKAKAREDKLVERARRAVVAAGGAAGAERIDAAALRSLIDRLGHRSSREELESLLAPFIDEAEEMQWLRQLEMGLARDLGEIAAGAEPGPALPLVRATDQALELARGWAAALEENTAAVAQRVEERVRREVEEEMLVKARGRLEKRLSELRITRPARTASAESGARASLARRLESVVAPALAEILGEGAPCGFDESLRPTRGSEPDAETNALALLLARLLLLPGETGIARQLGTILVDPGVALSPARERAFLCWLAREPRLGRLIILASRPEILTGMRRRGGGDWHALVQEVRAHDGRRRSAPAVAAPELAPTARPLGDVASGSTEAPRSPAVHAETGEGR